MSVSDILNTLAINPFEQARYWRRIIVNNVKVVPQFMYDGKAFICTLINTRCPIGCIHCMFFSNMSEHKNDINTMTESRLTKLMKLVRDSNTGYLLVSGGGECFLEPNLMNRIVEETKAEITWLVTGAHWARGADQAKKEVHKMYEAYLKGKHKDEGRKICIRVSLDSPHVDRISGSDQPRLRYIINLIKLFESEYAGEKNFFLQIHSLTDEEPLVDELCKEIEGKKVDNHDPVHDTIKPTEAAVTIEMKSGYKFEVTYAKRLISDLAANLRNKEEVKRKIEVFDKDSSQNERGNPAVKQNPDSKIGPNILVVYNGRVAGGWQSEMPDVPITLDSDDYHSIMKKTLSDPGVLGTIENGLTYRFNIIQEVCSKAVMRSKAVNIRDYTSLVLLEEDKIKLYYSIRVLQDLVLKSRIKKEEFDHWPNEIRFLVNLTKEELQELYHSARYDIIQQFIDNEGNNFFNEFLTCIKQYTKERNPNSIIRFFEINPDINKRTIDKWRLLLKRIVNDWYDIYTFSEGEIDALKEIENIISVKILAKTIIYEGLSLE